MMGGKEKTKIGRDPGRGSKKESKKMSRGARQEEEEEGNQLRGTSRGKPAPKSHFFWPVPRH